MSFIYRLGFHHCLLMENQTALQSTKQEVKQATGCLWEDKKPGGTSTISESQGGLLSNKIFLFGTILNSRSVGDREELREEGLGVLGAMQWVIP